MTNNQAKELISIFTLAQKLDSQHLEYISKLSKEKNKKNDEKIRNLFDEGMSKAYTLFEKDIKPSTYLFYNQEHIINSLNTWLDKEVVIKEIHYKYTNGNKIKLRDIIRTARNKNIHAKSKEDINLFIIYLHYVNYTHFTLIVKTIERIICERMEELTNQEKSKLIAFDPKNQVWLDNQKEFLKPFLEYLKINFPEKYKNEVKQLENFINFELTPDNVKIINSKK